MLSAQTSGRKRIRRETKSESRLRLDRAGIARGEAAFGKAMLVGKAATVSPSAAGRHFTKKAKGST